MSKKQKFWLHLLTYAVLIVMAIYCLFPFLWMADTALKPMNEVRTSHPTFSIQQITFGNFSRVLLVLAWRQAKWLFPLSLELLACSPH